MGNKSNPNSLLLKILTAGLVWLKFILFFALLFKGGIVSLNIWGLAVQIIGLTLYIMAFTSYSIRYFSFLPFPIKGAYIIMHGPYAVLRHPMYFAMLLITLPVSAEFFNLTFLLLQGSLAFVLCLLIYFEEYLMERTDLDYKNYCKYTKRLVPFVI